MIMHIVPRAKKGDGDAAPLQLSDAVCKLQDGVREELQASIRKQLASDGRQVIEASEPESDVPRVIKKHLMTKNGDFIAMSRELALGLRQAQTGINSGGMLMVAECNFSGVPAVLIVKFEQERGMRANPTTENGQNVFDMEYLRDLFLTNRSRVFKVGLFAQSGVVDNVLSGWAVDKQNAAGRVATFFLEDYLGCSHLEDPEEITKRFYEKSFEWINDRVENSGSRAKYAIAVMAEVQNNSGDISVDRFAELNMDSDGDADDYANYLNSHSIPRTFSKDSSLIQNRLEKMQVKFVNGAVVYFPISALDDGSVDIEKLDDRQTQITLTGEASEAKPRSNNSKANAVDS
ncbi:hypothetical protein Ani05nite_61880 [Amorphoplanes nipponensis]|uniref:Nucleoid-associated protein n=1 Tax=Actinoplanes nipponensis TaxID=135950 RepID=A0A919MKA5_9ACTN|nr:hypothetical protein Ani05nite_61880 [Actinoplanes nipponensis]